MLLGIVKILKLRGVRGDIQVLRERRSITSCKTSSASNGYMPHMKIALVSADSNYSTSYARHNCIASLMGSIAPSIGFGFIQLGA